MTYTISSLLGGGYGVHVGDGTMGNMTDYFPDYNGAVRCATRLADSYKHSFPESTVKVVRDNGFPNPATVLFTI